MLTYAGCGPYYFSARTPNKSITLKKNPNYKGPRPANVDTIQVNVGNSLEVIQQNVESGKSDYAAGGIPPTAWATLAQKYGVNKGRVFVKPQLGTSYLAMNHDRPLFKNNPQLAKAVNWTIDRQAILNQAGFLSGKRNDQILPPGIPGGKDIGVYPLAGHGEHDQEGASPWPPVTPARARPSSGRRTVLLLRSRPRSTSST